VTRMEKSRALGGWMQAVLSSDEDLFAEVLRRGIAALMEAERDAYVSAAPFERGAHRQTQRNGYKARTLVTRVGQLELQVPKTRDGGFYPSLLQRYQRSEAALISALAECYVQGVSTRKVGAICRELFGDELSHETVSRYVGELDAELDPWRRRTLEESYPYLMLDARYEKARVDHRIVDVAVLVAIGVSETGQRRVLGVSVVHGETRTSWGEFLVGLLERGLHGVELVVSDAHAGLQDARRRHFPGAVWQRCQRHFLMNALEKAPKALEEQLHKRLRQVWDESYNEAEARANLQTLVADLEAAHPELAEWLEREGEQTLSCFHFPPTHWLRIRTTNPMERLNEEIYRRSRVVRIFPNPASCCRLVSALLKEWDEDWMTTRRPYLNMEHLERRPELEPVAA
jgi:putative transposase